MILLTGGAGYIGSHVSKKLSSLGYEHICCDSLINGDKDVVKYGALEECDILHEEKLRQIFLKYPFKAVIHLASFAFVNESILNPEKYYINNIGGTIVLLKIMKEFKVNKIVFSSSCSVYGNAPTPITENSDLKPVNPYGVSKMVAEKSIINSGIPYSIFRFFNVVGTDPSLELGLGVNNSSRIVIALIESIINNKPFKIYGENCLTYDGTCLRDYVHVLDISDAIVLGLNNCGIYNLGSEMGYTVLELINKVEFLSKKKIQIIIEDKREGDPDFLVADSSLAYKKLKWKPQFSINDAIEHSLRKKAII